MMVHYNDINISLTLKINLSLGMENYNMFTVYQTFKPTK